MANNQNILLISETYIKKRSTILENIEMKFITPNILLAQDMNIQKAIGSNMYDEIISQFEDYKTDYDAGVTGITASDYVDTKYITLIDDYLSPCLLYYALSKSTRDFYRKVAGTSIVTQSGEFSNVVSEKEFINTKQDWNDTAEYYEQQMKNFIKDNLTTYTKYYESDGDCSDITPENDTYLTSGFYLKPRKNKCNF